MDVKDFKSSEGACIVSEEVIAQIACTAAVEVPGVAGMASRLNDIRGLVTTPGNKSVGVVSNENVTIIDVYVNLEAGVRIPEVASRLQRQIKSAVQSMTGNPVTKVNVHIEGIVFEDAKKDEE